jgi:dipeptidyl aminopeptidase/acylaminoacyl peptidase
LTDLLLLNLHDNSTHRLPAEFPQDVGSQTAPVWSSNGELISFIRGSRLETWAVSQLSQIAKVYIDNKDLMGIVATESRVVPRATRGEETLVVGVRDPKTKKEGFWRASAGTRRPQQLLEADITLGTSAYALLPELTPDGSQIIFRSESVDRPPELYQANRDLGDVKQITQFSTSLDLQIMGHSKLVSWNDEDGGQLTGSVLLPPHYQPGHKYPTIVSVYPTDDRARLLNHFGMEQNPQLWNNWQLYASRGYVVFVPDMDLRTSTRTFMSDIAKSVLPGIRKLIELGIVDSKRVACVGVSGGGYATLALLVQSSAFRAGVVVDGPSDLVDLYSYGEGRRIVRVLLGPDISLWKDRGLMIENSPYFFLDRINAPVLILQGTEDPVVPAHQSEKLFSALADLGKEGVYIEYDGEGHGFHVIEHQLDAFKRTLQWFDQHLSDLEETQQSSKLSSKTQERSTQASREIVPVVKHRE